MAPPDGSPARRDFLTQLPMLVRSLYGRIDTRLPASETFDGAGAGAAIAASAMADAAPARPNANRPSLCERFMDVLPKARI